MLYSGALLVLTVGAFAFCSVKSARDSFSWWKPTHIVFAILMLTFLGPSLRS